MARLGPLDATSWSGWPEGVTPIEGGVSAPAGFAAAGVVAGIKRKLRLDLALLVASARAVPAAGVFTTNAFAAAPVHLTRTHVARGPIRAVVVNSGNANACTGTKGMQDAVATAKLAAKHLGCSPWEVAVASTGVIGLLLPMPAVAKGVATAVAALGQGPPHVGAASAAEAIMTTDTFAKEVAVTVQLAAGAVRIGAMAKGSGMIRPNLATMLAFITTDARLDAAQAKRLLSGACDATFNRITVDGETSTNDCVLLLASGESGVSVTCGSDDEGLFARALAAACRFLALQIVRDGEGATKFVTIDVSGAADEGRALRVAFAVADSLLVKTALFGQDANWGRVLSAAGAADPTIDPELVKVSFGPHVVAWRGASAGADEAALADYLTSSEVELGIDLGAGAAAARVYTTDLSYDYVRINAEYRT